MTSKKIGWDFWTIVTVVIIALFALFLLYPLISPFLSGFKDTETGVWAIDNYARFSSRKYYKGALFSSFRLTFGTTVAAIILDMPLAYFISFYKIKGKGAPGILFIIPMTSPSFTGAYSWILFLGRSDTVTQFLKGLEIHTPPIYGFGGILLVFALRLYPFTCMYVSGALKKIDTALSGAAESLRCGGLKGVLTITMPLIAPTLVAAALLVLMNCTADFGTSVLTGRGYRVTPTLMCSGPVGKMGDSANFAAYMATIMMIVATTMFLFQKWYVSTKPFTMSSMRPIQPKEVYRIRSFFMHLFIYPLTATSIIPQYVAVYTSLYAAKIQMFVDGFSLESCRKVFSTAIQSIKNTYLYCLAAIVITMVLGMLIAHLVVRCKSWLTNAIDTVVMFPYIVPSSILGIMLLIAFNHLSMMLAGSVVIMAMSLVIRKQTYTLCSSSAALYQISPSVKKAAINPGDSPFVSFVKVTAKMMFPGVTPGVTLSWITLINELSSLVMLYTANARTMSVAIYNEVIWVSRGTAAALATILTVATVVSLFIFFKVSGNKDVTM